MFYYSYTYSKSISLTQQACKCPVIYLMTTYTEVCCSHSGIVLLLFTRYREIAESLSVEYWQFTFKEVCCMQCLLTVNNRKVFTMFQAQTCRGELPLTVLHVNPKCPDRRISTLVPQKQHHSKLLSLLQWIRKKTVPISKLQLLKHD